MNMPVYFLTLMIYDELISIKPYLITNKLNLSLYNQIKNHKL